MNMYHSHALFIFRRDLRLEDNTGLLFALKHAAHVIPCFILTPEQLEHNPYRSNHALQFMLESLEDLSQALQANKGRLCLFLGSPDKVVTKLIQQQHIDAVVVNRDYTPYSIQRDAQIAAVCKNHEIAFYSHDDALLHPPEQTRKANGSPYVMFTPFYRHALSLKVAKPVPNLHTHYYKGSIDGSHDLSLLKTLLPQKHVQAPGGRAYALKILKNLKSFSQYQALRDIPSASCTTHLSPHLKFTTCSPREVYHAVYAQLGARSGLLQALYWRDFFSSIAFHFPHVFQGAFHSKFDQIKWSKSKQDFERWCIGTTGFPIVDAGMREMNQTGYMHNRVRMIAGSFLVKDLHLNWQWGEQYFATTLIDYDPAINNGNWQWIASTGCDSQPYFRIFNPWSQQIKFDPDCLYIKTWIPEVSHLAPQILHQWSLEKHHGLCPGYPAPMLDHSEEAPLALKAYKEL
jgi:deoxyribodipyrimidine photo-lyase